MNLKLIVAVLVIAAVPVCAQAQKPSGAKVTTKADVQKVFKIISGNKTKTQTYCDITRLASQITEDGERKTDELYQKIDELAPKLGREYAALMDALQDIEPDSEVGREINSMLNALDNLCGG